MDHGCERPTRNQIDHLALDLGLAGLGLIEAIDVALQRELLCSMLKWQRCQPFPISRTPRLRFAPQTMLEQKHLDQRTSRSDIL